MWMQRVLDFWAAKELYTLIHTHASPTESHGRTTETSPLPVMLRSAQRAFTPVLYSHPPAFSVEYTQSFLTRYPLPLTVTHAPSIDWTLTCPYVVGPVCPANYRCVRVSGPL